MVVLVERHPTVSSSAFCFAVDIKWAVGKNRVRSVLLCCAVLNSPTEQKMKTMKERKEINSVTAEKY